MLKNINIYGLGALGSNLTLQLIKQYPQFNYKGFDFDKIEERNIKTQAFFNSQIGLPKAAAIPIIASQFIRKFNYTPVIEKVVKPPQINEETLYIDCFDNVKSRELLCQSEFNILHLGFSPFYTAEVIWDKRYILPGEVDPNQNDICEMTEATSFIHFVVNFAIMQIAKFLKDYTQDSYIILNKNNIKKL